MNPMINFLKLGLDGAAYRQQALADNISNVNTPDYKRQDVDFVSVLKQRLAAGDNKKSSGPSSDLDQGLKMSRTNGGHFTGNINSSREKKPFRMYSRTHTSYRNDGNNVDIEFEMSELAKNNIYYSTLTGQVKKRFAMLNNVIDKGGRN